MRLGSYVNDGTLRFNSSLFFWLYRPILPLCLGLILIAGCQHQSRHPVIDECMVVKDDMMIEEDMVVKEDVMIEEIMVVKQARQAFLSGDDLLAGEKFQALSEQEENPKSKHYGHFGLACLALVTAGDSSTFHNALVSFLQHYNRNNAQADSSGKNAAPPEGYEMLIRVLEHGSRLMTTEQEATLAQIDGLKAENAKKNKEIHKLQSLVKTLQHQISTLESIDQNLQEKRKNQ